MLEKDLLADPAALAYEGLPTYEDYQWNGQHCKSGLAYYDETEDAAMCGSPEKIIIM